MKNIGVRVILPIAVLLALGIALFTWVMWRQLEEDVESNLSGYATNLNRMLVASMKEAMRNDDRDALRQTIKDFGELEWVLDARIINKKGLIKFASDPADVDRSISRASDTCRVCHRNDPVPTKRVVVRGPEGQEDSILRASESIYLEKECLECHDKKRVGQSQGVLVVEFDLRPFAANVRRRASRSFLTLAIASAVFLIILFLVIRAVVIGRLRALSNTLNALRRGQGVPASFGSARDEIDELNETIAALSADLDARRLSEELSRRVELEMSGERTSIMIVDVAGRILLANDDAQERLSRSYTEVLNTTYAEVDPGRGALWSRRETAPVVFHPEYRAERGPRGADLVLLTLVDPEGEPCAFLEVGQRRPPVDTPLQENEEEPPAAGAFPREFMNTPYRLVGEDGERFFRVVLLLLNLTSDSLRTGGVLELDPTFADGMRAFKRLRRIREPVDEQVDVCNAAHIARTVANDFQKIDADNFKWHVLLPRSVPIVGHAVLVRQLVINLLAMATDVGGEELVLFEQIQRSSPRFFLGVWTNGVATEPPNPIRWATCEEISTRLNGRLEFNPDFNIAELGRVRPGRMPKLTDGVLFLCEFPGALA